MRRTTQTTRNSESNKEVKIIQSHTLTTAVPALDTEFPLLVFDWQRSPMTSWRRETHHAQKSSISRQPGSLKTFTDWFSRF